MTIDGTTSGVLVVAAAKSIQSYVLGSHRVKDMVGASSLIENLSQQLLPETLSALHIANDDCDVVTSSAGALRAIFRKAEDAAAFCECWPLLVGEFAPGLELSIASVALPVDPAGQVAGWQEAERRLSENRSFVSAKLPPASPLMLRSPAGNPAVASDGGELRDATDLRRECFDQTDALVARIFPDLPGHRFPRDINQLATGKYVAVVHADADGMGELLQSLIQVLASNKRADWREILSRFSKDFDEAARTAVATATQATLFGDDDNSPIHLRPIVVAGDDLTVIMPSEPAAGWLDVFLRTFAAKANDAVDRIWAGLEGSNRPARRVAASAGVVYIKPSFPFWRAYELAESLTGQVKRAKDVDDDKREHSGWSFHRITTSGLRATGTEVAAANEGVDGHVLTCCPYLLAEGRGATMNNLAKLMGVVGKLPRGPVRELLSELYRGVHSFNQRRERIESVAQKRGGKQWENLRGALSEITEADEEEDPFWSVEKDIHDQELRRTPIRDALELHAVGTKLQEEASL